MSLPVFTLKQLPYGYDSLAPALSRETLEFHHGKHLKAYVDNLNKLLPGSAFDDGSHPGLTLEDIILGTESGGIHNNAGQIYNHESYFAQFSPAPLKKEPAGKLREAIDRDFGGFEAFKQDFSSTSAGLFGSGWAWLVMTPEEKLEIVGEANGETPLAKGTPLLTFDVWEHAYYIDYRNRRPDYIKALWDIIDLDVIEKRLK